MAGDMTAKNFQVPMMIFSVFTTGDAKATWIAPVDCMLLDARAHIQTVGGSAGSTYIQIRNSTDNVNMLNSNGIVIAYGDADGAAEGTVSTTTSRLLVGDGDVICLDIDSCCSGAAEKDLVVWLTFVGR